MTRSLVFSALLDLDPTFGKMEVNAAAARVTQVCDDWDVDTEHTNLYAFVQQWLAQESVSV